MTSIPLMEEKRDADGSFSGSAVNTPSTRVPFRISSAPISAARRLAAVSVVKYGFPVPAPKITTRPFFEVPDGPASDEGLGDLLHLDAESSRDSTPSCSMASCSAIALIIVASMPM